MSHSRRNRKRVSSYEINSLLESSFKNSQQPKKKNTKDESPTPPLMVRACSLPLLPSDEASNAHKEAAKGLFNLAADNFSAPTVTAQVNLEYKHTPDEVLDNAQLELTEKLETVIAPVEPPRFGLFSHCKSTILHDAVTALNIDLVKEILTDIQQGNINVDINAFDQHGHTSLHIAVLKGHEELVTALLYSGADKTSGMNIQGVSTPFYLTKESPNGLKIRDIMFDHDKYAYDVYARQQGITLN